MPSLTSSASWNLDQTRSFFSNSLCLVGPNHRRYLSRAVECIPEANFFRTIFQSMVSGTGSASVPTRLATSRTMDDQTSVKQAFMPVRSPFKGYCDAVSNTTKGKISKNSPRGDHRPRRTNHEGKKTNHKRSSSPILTHLQIYRRTDRPCASSPPKQRTR